MTVQSATNTAAAIATVTTAETVAAVLPALAEAMPVGMGFLISGFVNFTGGTTGTTVQIRVRQGTTTAGAQVGSTDTHTIVAAAPQSIPFAQLFGGAAPAGNQFCVTVQNPAATANGVINDATIILDALSPGG